MDHISVQIMKHHQKVIIITFCCSLVEEIFSEKNVNHSDKRPLKGKKHKIAQKSVAQHDYGLMYHEEVEDDSENDNQPKIVKSKKNKKDAFDEDDLQNLFKSKKQKKKNKKIRKKKGRDYNDDIEDDENVEEIIIVDEPKPIIQGCRMIHK